MKLEIKEKKENALLGRVEISALLRFDSVTPSNKEVQAEIAKQLKTKNKGLVILKKIFGHYGVREADVSAFVYSDADYLLKVEKIKLEEEKKEAPKENSSDDASAAGKEDTPEQHDAKEPQNSKAESEEKKKKASSTDDEGK